MKKYLSLFIATLILLSSFTVLASERNVEISEIKFVDGSGNRIIGSFEAETNYFAKVSILNNTSGNKPVLMVCRYDSGLLTKLYYAVAANLTGEVSVPFILDSHVTGETVIEAVVIGGLKQETITALTATAVAGQTNTKFKTIRAGGKILTDTGADFYAVEANSLGLEVYPEDGGTSVNIITKPASLPGVATVKLTSATGAERTINVVYYEKISQLTAPLNVKYTVNGTTYSEVADFDADTKDYIVTLPDNVFYVKLEHEVLMGSASTLSVQDCPTIGKVYGAGEISYGDLYASTSDNSYKGWVKERAAVNNIIPIKNEETKAVIKVESEGVETEGVYTITFKSKQPRLTELTKIDLTTPIFTSGAAINKDGDGHDIIGTFAKYGYLFSASTVPESLVGGSVFSTLSYASSPATQTGNHYTFKADTPGTVYMLTSSEVVSSNLTGWTLENDKLSIAAQRNIALGVDSAASWGTLTRMYSKTFAAGETFTVPYKGKMDVSNGRYYSACVIVWDNDDIEANINAIKKTVAGGTE